MARTRRIGTTPSQSDDSQSDDPSPGPPRRFDPDSRPRLFASLISRFGFQQPSSEIPRSESTVYSLHGSSTSSEIPGSATPSRQGTLSASSAIANSHDPAVEATILSLKQSYIGQRMRLGAKYIELCEEELPLMDRVQCLNDYLILLMHIKENCGFMRTMYQRVEYCRAQAGIRMYMLQKKKQECREMLARADRMFVRRVARVKRGMTQKEVEEDEGESGTLLSEVLSVMHRYRNYLSDNR